MLRRYAMFYAPRNKNIKIARKDIFSFEFFAPFNSLFLEQKKNEKWLKNKRLMKNLRPEPISVPSAVKWRVETR